MSSFEPLFHTQNGESGRIVSRKSSAGRRVLSPEDYGLCYIEAMEYAQLPGQTQSPANEEGIDETISTVENEAEAIIQKAEMDAEVIREEAFKSGYESGRETAVVELRKATENLSKLLQAGLGEVASIKESILNNAENDIIRLSMAIARKIICSELKLNPEAIIPLVKESLKLVKTADEITIRVNPNDHAELERYMSDLMDALKSLKIGPLIVEDDPDLAPGGCIIVTDTNILDMSMESRMKAVESLLGIE